MNTLFKLKKGGFWSFIQKFSITIIQLIYISIMARLLSKSDFGLMAIASGLISIGVIFSEGGMGAALIQRKEINQKHINAALQGSIFFSLIISILIFFFSSNIADFFDLPQLNLLVKVISINIVLHGVSGISMRLLQKFYHFEKITKVIVTSSFIAYSFGIFFALYGFGVWSLVVIH